MCSPCGSGLIVQACIASVCRDTLVTGLCIRALTVFSLIIHQIYCRTHEEKVVKQHLQMCLMFFFQCKDLIQYLIDLLVGYQLIDPDLIHSWDLIQDHIQIFGKILDFIFFVFIFQIITHIIDVKPDSQETFSFFQREFALLDQIFRGTAAKVMIKGNDRRYIQQLI